LTRSASGEPTRGLVVAQFWSFAEGEERFGATGVTSGLRDGHHFVQTHVGEAT